MHFIQRGSPYIVRGKGCSTYFVGVEIYFVGYELAIWYFFTRGSLGQDQCFPVFFGVF